MESETIVERLTILETKPENAYPILNQDIENDGCDDVDVQKIIDKLNRLEEKLETMGNKETTFTQNDEKNLNIKRNILERLQELERINLEKDARIVSLTNKLKN